MKGQRIAFVLIIMMISALCIGKMNMSFNRLSRYQYTDSMTEEQQQLVTEKLTDDEIEYLIEWAISPKEYIAYIEEPRFSIYHIEKYNLLQLYHPYLLPKQVVELTETSGMANDENVIYTFDELSELINSYDADTILYWISHGDDYQEGGKLIRNAKSADTIVTDIHGISKRIPYDLIEVTDVPVLDDTKNISLQKDAAAAFAELCDGIVADKVSSRPCGGLVIQEGYRSYDEQKVLYDAALAEYGEEVLFYEEAPGHSEHQLGLAVDLAVSGLRSDNFEKTRQYQWLIEHAWEYGFIQSYSVEAKDSVLKQPRINHWRYIGKEMAEKMIQEDLNIMDLIKE